MNVESMPLTPEQIACIDSPEGDWLKLTPEQEKFFRDTGPGMVCTIYDGQLLRLSGEHMASCMEVAFKTASKAALELLGEPLTETVNLKVHSPEVGQAYLRVTATNDLGKSASAIGMIPDPRHH
ncbi:MAG: hypothetical protein IAE66_06290 [Xanthomonadaceae bacterium]|nr:hypothetical protein [Xanthomonadaceae bacterium]